MKRLRTGFTLLLVLLCGCRRNDAPPPDHRRTPLVKAVEKAMPSVVNIGTERIVKTLYDDPLQRSRETLRNQFFSDFFGPPPPPGHKRVHSLGSGIVIHSSGLILSNYHVIEKASVIYVTLANGENRAAALVAGDPVSDLALLKVNVLQPMKAIEFAADNDLLLGEQVIVLGNPYGLSQSVTVGVLSSKNREAHYNGKVLFKDILQTDAAVNPGNSGGPMLNIDGKLIGVNIAIYKDAQNIGFAVPVKRVRRLLEHWLSPEFIGKHWLGIGVRELNDGGGVEIVKVFEKGPAYGMELKVGDVIRSVNGQPVNSLLDYNKCLIQVKNNESVEIGLRGLAGIRKHKLMMTALPKLPAVNLVRKRVGLEFEDGKNGDKGLFGKGLRISNVVENSPADRAGLYAGLFLMGVNGKAVQSLEAVSAFLRNVRRGDVVSLTVVRYNEQGPVRMTQQITVRVKVD